MDVLYRYDTSTVLGFSICLFLHTVDGVCVIGSSFEDTLLFLF